MDQSFQEIAPNAIIADRHGQHLGLIGTEDLQGTRIGRTFDRDPVAGVQQGSRHEVEALLRAIDDEDIGVINDDAFRRR